MFGLHGSDLQAVGLFRHRFDESLIRDRGEVDANVQQGTDDSRAGTHHGHCGVGHGVAIATARGGVNHRQQRAGCAGYLHRHLGGILRLALDGLLAHGLLFVGLFGQLEGGKDAVVRLGVTIDVGQQLCRLLGHTGRDLLHLVVHLGVLLTAYGEVGYHGRQRCCQRTVQCGNASASRHGIVAGHFVNKFLYG